jgi:ActR/RegA family two-component response regulator
MGLGLGPVERILVVDDDETFLDAAGFLLSDRHVAVERTEDSALSRCRAERFDLVICDLFLGRFDTSGLDVIKTLHAENQSERRLALVSAGFSVEQALGIAKRLPPEIIIRHKRAGIFESILAEAETGVMPDDVWQGDIETLDDVKREYVRGLLARVGHNRAEAARRLGVHRATVFRLASAKNGER